MRGLTPSERALLTCLDYTVSADWQALDSLKLRGLVTTAGDGGAYYCVTSGGMLAVRLDAVARATAEVSA